MNKQEITELARRMVRERGLMNLSRVALCEAAGVPNGSFPSIMGCGFTEFFEQLRAEQIAENPHNEIQRNRVGPEFRKKQLLEVALELAAEVGYSRMTREALSRRAGVSEALISKHFGTMTQLRVDLMRAAVKREFLPVVMQGLAGRDPRALKAPADVRERAAQLLNRV